MTDLPICAILDDYQDAAFACADWSGLDGRVTLRRYAEHLGDEDAVAAYFDFAHALTVARRLRDLTSEMEDLVELVTGRPATPETRRTFRFPD